MTLTDKLERMTKLVAVMAEDEEARAAYKALRREIEPDVMPLLDLVSKACILTPTSWDHVAIIEDINDVVLELLPESQMSVCISSGRLYCRMAALLWSVRLLVVLWT